MNKPVIGISSDFSTIKPKNKRSRPRQRYALNRSYINAVIAAGGVPLLLAGTPDIKDIQQQLERVDGLLLTGGMDHDPKLYGAKKHPKTDVLDKVRQDYEVALANTALKTKLPILGVCLGCQTLNVVGRGTLYQDIPSEIKTKILHSQKKNRNVQTHKVNIDKQSRLFKVIGKNSIKTNSFHHQSIKDVAPGYRVAAMAPDNVVEAIEPIDGNRFVFGVQWHPEELIAYGPHLALFKALVEAAKKP